MCLSGGGNTTNMMVQDKRGGTTNTNTTTRTSQVHNIEKNPFSKELEGEIGKVKLNSVFQEVGKSP